MDKEKINKPKSSDEKHRIEIVAGERRFKHI